MGRAGNARFTAETTQEKSLPLSQKLQRKEWITYDNLYVRVQKNVARRDVSKTAIKGAKTIHFSLCIVDFGLQRTRKERFGQKRLHNLAIIVNQRSKQSGYLLKNVSIFAFFDPFRYILPNPRFLHRSVLHFFCRFPSSLMLDCRQWVVLRKADSAGPRPYAQTARYTTISSSPTPSAAARITRLSRVGRQRPFCHL